jgi:beta-galactosidase
MNSIRSMRIRTVLLSALLLNSGFGTVAAHADPQSRTADKVSPAPEHPARERISLNDQWRFQKGDPPGNTISLLYDVRPEARDRRDGGPAGAQPTAAEKPAPPVQALIKQWILPTGNAFIKDPARKFARPLGNWGGEVAYVQPDFDDSSWQRVNLPHDWAIEGPFITTGPSGGMGRLPSPGEGWYRKKITIPASDAGKSIFLDVDGAMSYAAVWLNGRIVGGWPYGYASWRVDLTPYVVPGAMNQLAIRLDNPPNSSRWYPGGGIYRNVWLTKTRPIHIGHWGTYVTTPRVSSSSATIDLQITIDNDSPKGATVSVATRIYALDAEGRKLGAPVAAVSPVATRAAAGTSVTVKGSVTIANPRLWGPPPNQHPDRYVAVTTVSQQRKVTDSYETRFGIREVRFDPDSGIYVNGERIYLKGVNDHHDLGALGAAFNYRAAQRQLEMLREMGCNSLRTSHNPPAPELLELTDSMGFLVMDEAFDVWIRQKTPLDFHLIFPDWSEQDLRAMIRRDRNHPSVFLWSIGNEVGEQMTGDAGAALAKQLGDIVHAEDLTRPATTAMNWSQPTQLMPAVVDVISLNYQGAGIRTAPGKYPDFHEKFPTKVLIGSEVASAFSSRGVYLFPVAGGVGGPVRPGEGGDPETHQVSAYELHAADFGSSADRVFASQDRNPYVAGEYVWTGWDYLGEPTPYYTSRSSYSGIIDLAGFKKDRFYLYQAHWRPELPMAHILPHWTWPERVGQITPVHVFTSGDEGELFLNGRSLGRQRKGPFEYRLRWDSAVYEPGTLEAVTYKNGAKWATDSVKTAGAPAGLEAVPDRPSIRADGRDLSFVTVRVVDSNGHMVPRADNRIKFSIEGPGEIAATDNGDPTSFEPFQAHERKAFNGLCLVIVRAKAGLSARITIIASSEGLRDGATSITAGASP